MTIVDFMEAGLQLLGAGWKGVLLIDTLSGFDVVMHLLALVEVKSIIMLIMRNLSFLSILEHRET